MSKKYKYVPNHGMDDSYVVAEFVNVMKKLEEAHKCPVRLVRTAGCFGFRHAVYELIQNKEQQ